VKSAFLGVGAAVGLAIVLGLVHRLMGEIAASFLDQLVICCILAYGIVRYFFP
jgi:hypothetical protein